MIQHMNLVFQAVGLSVGEGGFQMACCNHTDDRGYALVSVGELADEAHMAAVNVRAIRHRLVLRGLLATKERFSLDGARIADLYRVNLEVLASMKGAGTEFGQGCTDASEQYVVQGEAL
ncbi:hypothetical protein [Streptomyces sp. NBC_00467]|uniref:hypothetical protein n=1 Tax=Streptomyces sp. NBC_00467 TaxID=2975752 RepID=UPI002E199E3A